MNFHLIGVTKLEFRNEVEAQLRKPKLNKD